MKLSTKGRYGVRLMLDLALHYKCGSVFLKDVAMRQNISEKYLWQLTGPLKAARLINSVRGPRGGYSLARKPPEIKLKEIVDVLEGPLCIVDCVDDPALCERSESCITRNIWKNISQSISDVLDSVSLQDMVEMHRQQFDEKEKIENDQSNCNPAAHRFPDNNICGL